jgi:RNA polymerase sigma-70 factor (ECF subfamily)
MGQPNEGRGWSLENQRNYLLLLARCLLPVRLRACFDPEDLVQETVSRAYPNLDQCQAPTEAMFRNWLRTILNNVILGKLAKDPGPCQQVENSSRRLADFVADPGSTPSQGLMRDEQLVRLAEALAQLPKDQRQVIQLCHLDGCSRAEAGRQMGRSEAAVNGLMIRGLRKLRLLLEPQ